MSTKTISIDGGALINNSAKQFGNYTFSHELLTAIKQYDHTNQYRLYLQEPVNLTAANITPIVVKPRRGWMKLGVAWQELSKRSRLFLALNQALPGYTSAKIIAFSHGLAPVYFPQLYPDSATKLLKQTKIILKHAHYVIVSSTRVKEQMVYKLDLSTDERKKIKVLPFGIGETFPLTAIPKYKRKQLLLFVGNTHPIKNHQFILQVFARLQQWQPFKHYKLALVGINQNELGPESRSPNILPLGHIDYQKLPKYYQEASCLVSASRYESFNLPLLEALSQNTPVVATNSATIPELSPFVNTAPANVDCFANQVKTVLTNPTPINQPRLRQQFAWDKYIAALTSLYD